MKDTICKIIVEILRIDASKFSLDKDLVGDLGADSVHLAEISLDIEQKLGVALSDEDITNARTGNDLIALVERRLAEAAK